ncbi:type III pantothenate kinase [Aestuariibacter sp. A3R04]|uniref:type III pantothenate kinase n=1 Tax=Aestuariibacter sp. A3R04 TaxID=2841571 RepID=UPI001C098C9C|nr:type III pantothenate kinase [Aestuariibacter sp. A3R04]
MVCESTVLLVDAGNSRIKSVTLAEVEQDNIRVHPDVNTLCDYIISENVTHIVFSNVGRRDIAERIVTTCAQKKIRCEQIHTEKENFGVKNSYENVSKLGVDRWLAMVAAQQMTSLAFCVIDLGTAITCDFVVDGEHLGGWITPGFRLMQESLVKNTANVTSDDFEPREIALGQDTEKCVTQGCHAAINGVYLTAIGYLASKRTEFAVIIGGGDKNMLAINDATVTIRSANLVVQGLARYARSQLFA